MSIDETGPPEENLDLLAAEYSLGLLDAPELARVAELRSRDPRFDAAVRAWENRLMPLAVGLEPVQPPASVWAKIEVALSPEPRAGLWDNLKFWRYFGFVGWGLGAAGLAAVMQVMPHAPPAVSAAVASLKLSSGGEYVATAERGGGGTVLVVSPADVTVPAQKSAELWLILPDKPPLALGVLASATPVIVQMPAADIGAVTLAVSLEPLGGSPDGKVNGPVVGSGKFSPL